eukprot:5497139-Heterocapsa_arctica.AAC.1
MRHVSSERMHREQTRGTPDGGPLNVPVKPPSAPRQVRCGAEPRPRPPLGPARGPSPPPGPAC